MKKVIIFLALLNSFHSYSQNKLFKVYNDSADLVNDANELVADFVSRVNKIAYVIDSTPVAILNTKPFLIFYSPRSNQVNLPIWHQVILPQKKFFTELGGGEKQGEKMFGHFFNGFYLPHELGHALQKMAKIKPANFYSNEYVANEIAIQYWRSVNRKNELKECYKFAKKIVKDLPSPVPAGEDPIKYFNEHYSELGADPYKYGYYQFAQFIKIYEDKKLMGFEDYIRNFLSKGK